MFRKLKRPWKVVLLCIVLLGVAFVSYMVSRVVALNNNDLLLHYEEYEPIITYNEIGKFTTYEYTLEDGVVYYLTNDGSDVTHVVVYDKKRGVIKQYDGKVLRFIRDHKTIEICDMFFETHKGADEVRTAEECEQLNQLLESEDYETISNVWKEQVITTTSGTVFVP